MNGTELDILKKFRAYRVTANQMLFFQTGFAESDARKFSGAMQSMIERGLVIKERRHGAYSLTARGYRESLKLS